MPIATTQGEKPASAGFFLPDRMNDSNNDDDSPCNGCEHAPACKLDGFECRAFRTWCDYAGTKLGRWQPEWRTRLRWRKRSRGRPPRTISERGDTASIHVSTGACIDITSMAAVERGDSAIKGSIEATASTREEPPPIVATMTKPKPVRKRRPKVTPDQLGTYKAAVMLAGREYIARALKLTNGNRIEAAAIAGLNRSHVYALVKQFGIASNSEQTNGST